jgi:hypothetical protein
MNHPDLWVSTNGILFAPEQDSDESTVESTVEGSYHPESNRSFIDPTTNTRITFPVKPLQNFGTLWCVNLCDNEISFLKLRQYAHALFPHNRGELGSLITFRRIHHTLGNPFYRPGFDGIQFFYLTDTYKLQLQQLAITPGFFDRDNYIHCYYILKSEHLDLEETHRLVQTGFTLMQ